MTKFTKQIRKLIDGNSDKNFAFSDLCTILHKLGFEERIKASHHIFWKEGLDEIINIQNGKDGRAKPYQVKQVRDIIMMYKLINEID